MRRHQLSPWRALATAAILAVATGAWLRRLRQESKGDGKTLSRRPAGKLWPTRFAPNAHALVT